MNSDPSSSKALVSRLISLWYFLWVFFMIYVVCCLFFKSNFEKTLPGMHTNRQQCQTGLFRQKSGFAYTTLQTLSTDNNECCVTRDKSSVSPAITSDTPLRKIRQLSDINFYLGEKGIVKPVKINVGGRKNDYLIIIKRLSLNQICKFT